MGTACVYQLVVGEKREEKAQLLSVQKMNISTDLKYSESSCLKKSICLIQL